MKVLFLTSYPIEGSSSRYRIFQYLPYLKAQGVKCAVRPFWSSRVFLILYKHKLGHNFIKFCFFVFSTICRLFDLILAMRYDVVFIHREACPLGGAFFETILKFLGKKIIFDFDDAIFLPSSSGSNRFIGWLKRSNKVRQIIGMSKYVIAGNNYLAEFALRYNRRTVIIPTTIDTEKYCPALKKNNKKIVIGWIGSVTTVDFLNEMKDIFLWLSDKYGNIVFKIVGGNFLINGLPNVFSKPWSLQEEQQDLGEFDIGIMPMPDNEWTKGKCAFKAILYMGLGIPAICSPVGMNKEIIKDGENGFLADGQDEWVAKLSMLIDYPQLREKIGLAARRTVEEKFSVKANAPKILDIINRAYDG